MTQISALQNNSLPQIQARFAGQRRIQSFSTPSVDTFVRFSGASQVESLRNDPVFTKNGLTPAIATAKDLDQVVSLALGFVKEGQDYSIVNMCLYFQKRTDEELKQYLKRFVPDSKLPAGVTFDQIFPTMKPMLLNPDLLKKLLEEADEGAMKKMAEQEILPLIKQRFIDNPQGALIILKNKEDEVVAMEGVNQFQDTHDFQINQGISDAIDPKHGLVSFLYVKPEYRNRGIATALKKAIIQYARDQLKYQYIWSPTEQQNSSHRTNQKLGYKPLGPETRFKDSPAFTPQKIAQLLDEYNVGSRQLCWLPTCDRSYAG